MAKDFLLEIGTEEIPAKFAPGVRNQLREQVQKYCQELRLDYQDLKVYTTPRRFAVLIQGLAENKQTLRQKSKGLQSRQLMMPQEIPLKRLKALPVGKGWKPRIFLYWN